MRTKLRWLLALGAIVALALAVSACGSDDSGDSSSSSSSSASSEFAPPTEAPSDAQQGGDLTVIAACDVDYIDPGAAYYQFTYMVTSATQSGARGLRARRRRGADAAAWRPTQPTVSDDGKTITYTMRDDVKYSPPVEPRRSTAADVKYAIERSLLPGVPNGYVADVPGRRRGHRQGDQGGPGQPDRRRPGHQRDHRPGRHDARDQAHQHDVARRDRRADAAGRRSGSGGVREGVRRREPVDLRRAPGRRPART